LQDVTTIEVSVHLLQENKGPVTASGVLFWFCWMWLVAVVGRCLAGCSRTETFIVFTYFKTAPHNCYQPHPAEPEYTKCSNGFFDLLKMGIMMPETC
jgi:protein tyrosine phosphatase